MRPSSLHRAFSAALLILAAAALPSLAFARGADAHRLVAKVAAEHLTPAAGAEINHLLALEPGATLASISNWADETRTKETAPWHYVNLPRGGGCTYDAVTMCPGGACVVGAIERQEAILASHAPDAERLQALKYVVHFMADVHQPLHAGFADDRGGNTFQL